MAKLTSGTRIYGNIIIDTFANVSGNLYANNIGIGTTAPDTELTILGYPQTVSYPVTGNSTTPGTDLHITGADANQTRITQDAFGTGSYIAFTGRAARGTAAAPTQTISGDTLSQFTARGFSSGTLQFGNVSTARVDLVAAESFTDTSRATNVQIYTTATTAITPTLVATFSSANGLSVTGNVAGGNILTAGLISATSTITSAANIIGGNITTVGLITATGNVIGGNVLTVGLMSSTGNGIHGNILTVGLVSATSTITSAANIIGGNITTVGLITATGNVIGGNVLTAGLMSSTGNGIHGNILTVGLITATGNVIGGNVLTAGLMSSTGNAIHGNINTLGAVSAGGNIIVGGNVSLSGNVVFPAIPNLGLIGSLGGATYSANMTSAASVTTTLPSTNYTAFTVEFWINPIVTQTTGQYLWWIGDKSGSLGQIGILGSNPAGFYLYTAGGAVSATPIITMATLGTGSWVHIAVVKTGGNYYCYTNGTLTVGPVGSASQAFANFSINAAQATYMSNFRITNTAVYTANFTVPVAPLTAVTGTQLLTLQSATVIDNGPYALSLTSSATTMVASPQPFGAGTPGANFLFDGSGSWVSSGNLIPAANITYNLGNSTNRWSTIYGNIISVAGNVAGGNILTAGLMSSTGNAIHGNILTAGIVSATGNITGNYFIGNGSQLTGISAGGGGASISNGTSNVNITTSGGNVTVGVAGTANVATFTTTGVSAPVIQATNGILVNSGNITANYTIAAGTNGFSVGPITTANNISVTVAAGQRWVII